MSHTSQDQLVFFKAIPGYRMGETGRLNAGSRKSLFKYMFQIDHCLWHWEINPSGARWVLGDRREEHVLPAKCWWSFVLISVNSLHCQIAHKCPPHFTVRKATGQETGAERQSWAEMLSGYRGKLIGAAILEVSHGPGNDERYMARSIRGQLVPSSLLHLVRCFLALPWLLQSMASPSPPASSPKTLFQSPQWWWPWNLHLPLRPVPVSISHGVSIYDNSALTPWARNSSSEITQPHLPQHSLTCGCTDTRPSPPAQPEFRSFTPIHNQLASSSFLLSSLFPVSLLPNSDLSNSGLCAFLLRLNFLK